MPYDMKCSDIVDGDWCTGELSIIKSYPAGYEPDLAIEYLCNKCSRSYLVTYQIKTVRAEDRQAKQLGLGADASNLVYDSK
jgi:hypothetical protein